jgi:hypothetical protein
MATTQDMGTRIELVPMDSHCSDITIALYRQDIDGIPGYRIHTYSQHPSAQERIEAMRQTMLVLGGVEIDDGGFLHFPCGHAHQFAIRRLFLDACKRDPQRPLGPLPLHIFDKKGDCEIFADSLSNGRYAVRAEGNNTGIERRTATVARGLIRLGEMEENTDNANLAAFGCGQAHDALVALLLVRAPNVRAAMREAEEMSSRGQLVAPSAQN